tara:strand:+ start:659 stop:844 length:186 start_codon:yes stop_codon:yes gene_type:complete
MIYTLVGLAAMLGLILTALSSIAESLAAKERRLGRERVLWEYEHIKLTRPNQIIETWEDAR